MESARNGDAESFGALYERYYAAMTWLAYSILLDRDLAEDAAQQAFVTACENLTDLRDVNRFSSWLARICRNEAHQLIRNRKRRTSCEQANPGQTKMQNHDDNQSDRVKAAIDQLPPIYREIIILHYYSRMSYQEIAAVSGIAAQTVRSRLLRARKKIETRLTNYGYRKR